MDDVLRFADAAELREWVGAHPDAEPVWVAFERVRFGRPAPAMRVDAVAEAFAALSLVETGRRAEGDGYAVLFAPGTVKKAKPPAWMTDEPMPEPAFSSEHERIFREDGDAWTFFERQPPRYRRAAMWWVESGKSERTRESRFATLVESSAAGEKVAALQRQM